MPSSSNQRLAQLVQDARCADDVDAVATALLDCLQQLFAQQLRDALSDTPFRLLRGMVHIRPNGAYRHLTLRNWQGNATTAPEVAIAPSATLWRYVHDRNVCAQLDVVIAQLRIGADAPLDLDTPDYAAPNHAASANRATLPLLTRRQTTHVLALPVRGRGDAVHGMVSIEAQCNACIGAIFPWSSALADAQLMVDAIAPLLLDLPGTRAATPSPAGALPVIGARMREVMALVRAFASQQRTILLTGPTGSGKSQLARYIHEQSPAARGSFVSFSLHGANEDLQLGHLNGWRKGAFSGAIKNQKGLIESAAQGTLFLDEIQNLTLQAQAGLLQLLSAGTYLVMGEEQERRVDSVRFIVASNANLQREVAAGRFRKDLLYRINVLSIELPGLDERIDEIPQWVQYMAQQAHRQAKLHGDCRVSDAAVDYLAHRRWEGNLRELENIVVRAHAIATAAAADVQPIEISLPHVQRALSANVHDDGAEDVFALLLRVAREINRRSAADVAAGRAPLGDYVRQNNVLFAMLWSQARDGGALDPATIAGMLGKERSMLQRNYTKELRRELQRLEDFARRVTDE